MVLRGSELWKSLCGQIHDGRQCLKFQSSNRYNSAADCLILLKCGTEFYHVTADTL